MALGMHDDTNDKVKAKGSSAAAALVSGIAALVWEQNPNLSRSSVISILKNAASIYDLTGTKNSNYGWGVIDAEKAVRDAYYGIFDVSISGPSTVATTGTKYWTANVTNAGGNITYAWYWDGQFVGGTQTYARAFNSLYNGTAYLELLVTTSVGQRDEAQKLVYITDDGPGGGPGPIE